MRTLRTKTNLRLNTKLSATTAFSKVECCTLADGVKKHLPLWKEEPEGGGKYGAIIVTSTTGNGDAPENASR